MAPLMATINPDVKGDDSREIGFEVNDGTFNYTVRDVAGVLTCGTHGSTCEHVTAAQARKTAG
jgi:hypothetical protein